ncbi:hypothetical protein JK364_46870 [Streptomyces sp. 110]|uniref:Uncharacterized protein n=1 Tax=Streptomyces endocoffeicus TaxID=2898945 RepID=A0ABS1Q521_9ACTN|nr:DUF6585 family protein [Streptomyces endocoffeicus]MBL1119780.1 hypothetical protein [Streptomyces endocoffeicus]
MPDLSAVADGKHLGKLRTTYRPYQRPPWSERPASAKAGTLIGGGISAAAVLLITVAITTAAPVAGVILIVILVCVALLGISRRRGVQERMQGRELHFYENGLVNVGVGNKGPAAIRWDEASVLQDIVRHTRNGALTHTTYLYTLTAPDGTHTKISGIIGGIGGMERPEEWGRAIQQLVTTAQVPRSTVALDRGETLSFGDIRVSRDGIAAKGNSVAWSQLQEIRVKDGYVSLRVAGKWRALTTTAVASIPNYFVFLALAERMRAAGRP